MTSLRSRHSENVRKGAGSPQSGRRWIVVVGMMLALAVSISWLAGFATNPVDARGEGRAEEKKPHSPKQETTTPKDAVEGIAFETHVKPFLTKYCIDCHGPKMQREGVAFHEITNVRTAIEAREMFRRSADMLTFDAMPPDGHEPRPTEKERADVLRWLDARVFAIDCSGARDPGHETIRRLNRVEYDNTIRDLVGVDLQPARDFPSDDVGEGFDNIGDVLSISPLLFEKYLDAADAVADAAIEAEAFAPFRKRIAAEDLKHSKGVVPRGTFNLLASRGEVWETFHFPTDGEYRLRVLAAADQAGPEKAKMAVILDGKPVETIEVAAVRGKAVVYEAKFETTKGRHRVEAAFINDYYMPKAPDPNDRDRNLHLGYFEVERIGEAQFDDLPETHRRIVFVRPGKGVSVDEAASRIIRRFAPRAFRRPVTDAEAARYVKLVADSVTRGESFEKGVQLAVQAILTSPHFLFRVEADPLPDDADGIRELNDYEVASRLSYFLWSSMPDEELFALAARKELRLPKVLEAQVRRMLQDPKASALAANFGGQWLNLNRLDEFTPDPETVGRFDEALRADTLRETKLFFEAVMREDRPLGDFLTADYTFLNARLARHYGIPGVRGNEFRKVSLAGRNRRGVLTHASILALTSNPKRTSPVKRGKWVLQNMLGGAPPDPPPGIPDLEETGKAHEGASLREQLEIHRASPACASCHLTMDEIGFGLENFDALGRWRTKDGAHAVDSSGELPSGEKFSGPLELVEILSKREEDFYRCLTEKMLVYALGRGLLPNDQCTVDEIVARLSRDGGRFSSLVIAIVRSEPFLKRRGQGNQP